MLCTLLSNIQIEIFNSFLTFNELVNFDTSICNKTIRCSIIKYIYPYIYVKLPNYNVITCGISLKIIYKYFYNKNISFDMIYNNDFDKELCDYVANKFNLIRNFNADNVPLIFVKNIITNNTKIESINTTITAELLNYINNNHEKYNKLRTINISSFVNEYNYFNLNINLQNLQIIKIGELLSYTSLERYFNKTLINLNLSKCENLKELIVKCTNLEILNLSNCNKLLYVTIYSDKLKMIEGSVLNIIKKLDIYICPLIKCNIVENILSKFVNIITLILHINNYQANLNLNNFVNLILCQIQFDGLNLKLITLINSKNLKSLFVFCECCEENAVVHLPNENIISINHSPFIMKKTPFSEDLNIVI